MRCPVKVVAFDLDGVLVESRSSWSTLHEYFGSNVIVNEAGEAEKFKAGLIDYVEWMRRDTEAIIKASGGKVRREDLERALLNYKLEDGAEELIQLLKKLGIHTAIVSGGIDILAKHVGERLGIDIVYANRLLFDDKGNLVPGGEEIVNPLRKSDILNKISMEFGIPLSEFMYVGDSDWDLNAFKVVGFPILFLRDYSTSIDVPNLRIIRSLRELKELLEELCSIHG